MARMQKKKPAEKKKKGGSDESTGSGVATVDKADAGGAAQGAAGKEVKQKKQKASYSGSGRTAAEQTFVVRLLDRYFGNWMQFLREVKAELGRVTWPTRKETIGTTAVVLVFVFIIAGYLGIVDLVLSSLVRLIL
ncbi:MAG: preprotein translocase subunit SecE [Thermodesulfobacteriota bacterium]